MQTSRSGSRRVWTIGSAVAAAAIFISLLFAARAEAGAYTAWECAGRHGGPAPAPDVGNNNGGNPTKNGSHHWSGWNTCADGGTFSGAGLDAGPGATNGQYIAYDTLAPPGTRFTGGHFDTMGCTGNGVQTLYSYGNGSVLQAHILQGPVSCDWNWHGVNWSTPYRDTTQFVHWLVCHGGCANGGGVGTSNMIFNLYDESLPSVSVGGTLTGGGWRNSGGTFSVSGSDSGSGLYFVDQYINGSRVRRSGMSCSLTTLYGGTVGTRLRPCPTSGGSGAVSYSVGSFRQGANTLAGCAYDFASDANYNGKCTSTMVHIDTVAPTMGSGGLNLAGGSAWRGSNDFDVSWANPSQAHAPIDGAYYRITRVGGGYDSGVRFVAGSNRHSLNDLQVPEAGEYQLKVWTRDAAGNHSESSAQTTTLRFDPKAPPATEAYYNGWIRRNDFELTARWDRVNPTLLGPAGLDGYAVSVTKDPTSDPCVSDADPSPSCSAAEVNNDGIDDTEMPIPAREEGDWYIHVAPVTGAGVKGPVRHTPMPVDTTDPSSSISGATGGWTNTDVTVKVSASDALSGMAPSPTHPMDPQPRTCLQVDGGTPDCEPDANLTRVISGEGAHTLAYFARDLAGNENNGRPDTNGRRNNPPRTAAVRIDKTPPQLAFASSREVNDPARIVVHASDPLSGVAGGTIELRRLGSNGSWAGLASSVEGQTLIARVPDDVQPGRYEFRAQANDRAGNTGSTDRRADGSRMVEELPLKEAVRLTATVEGVKKTKPSKPGKGKGKCKGKKPKGKCKGKRPKSARAAVTAKVRYGEAIRLRGVLETASGSPLRGRDLVVTERLADGGHPAVRTSAAATNSDGGYAIDLKPGPSRRVTVSFEGDGRYRPTEADPVDVAVKAKVLAFSSSKTVPETKAIRFRGRVGTAGVQLGQHGKRVELQYLKSRRNWRTIDSGQTKRGGAFKLRYGLRANYVRKTKVRFRVVVPPEGGWPYAGTAKSRARKTVILP